MYFAFLSVLLNTYHIISGDELTVIDVVNNEDFKICNSLEHNDWLSSGNIMTIRFRSAVNGHGLAYSYEAYPQNKTLPGKLKIDITYSHLCWNLIDNKTFFRSSV